MNLQAILQVTNLVPGFAESHFILVLLTFLLLSLPFNFCICFLFCETNTEFIITVLFSLLKKHSCYKGNYYHAPQKLDDNFKTNPMLQYRKLDNKSRQKKCTVYLLKIKHSTLKNMWSDTGRRRLEKKAPQED